MPLGKKLDTLLQPYHLDKQDVSKAYARLFWSGLLDGSRPTDTAEGIPAESTFIRVTPSIAFFP